MTRILHVARVRRNKPACAIHPNKWIKAITVCWPSALQKLVHCDPPFPVDFNPHVVIIHAINLRPHLVAKAKSAYPKAAIVPIVYSQTDQNVLSIVEKSDLVFGKAELPGQKPTRNWVNMPHLIDTTLFHPSPLSSTRTIDIFIARGFNLRAVYWQDAIQTIETNFKNVFKLDRYYAPQEMARLYQQSRLVSALREDPGPSYTAIEAALCGAIPLVSNYGPVIEDFQQNNKECGAIWVHRNTVKEDVERALALPNETRNAWVTRNWNYFQSRSLKVGGTFIVKILQSLLVEKGFSQ